MSDEHSWRGYKAIGEVAGRMRPLVDFLKANRPDVREITLAGKDYDLVKRWSKGAYQHGFTQTLDGELRFEGVFLIKRGQSEPRYKAKE